MHNLLDHIYAVKQQCENCPQSNIKCFETCPKIIDLIYEVSAKGEMNDLEVISQELMAG